MKVEDLPRRTAHAVHALLVTEAERAMPVTASEVLIYDEESLSARSTGNALAHAARLGLVFRAGPYWLATNAALDRRSEFEDRYLAETAEL